MKEIGKYTIEELKAEIERRKTEVWEKDIKDLFVSDWVMKIDSDKIIFCKVFRDELKNFKVGITVPVKERFIILHDGTRETFSKLKTTKFSILNSVHNAESMLSIKHEDLNQWSPADEILFSDVNIIFDKMKYLNKEMLKVVKKKMKS